MRPVMDIREKMKRDWDRRAKVDPLYWVAATEEADEASYRESAEHDATAFLEGLRDRVPASARVLDLGCGIGRMTAPLAGHFAEVVGVDVSGEMIAQADALHAAIDNLSFTANNGTDLAEYADESFDLVLSYSVLPHLPPEVVASYFREVNRVLKPGGWYRYQFWVGPERMMADNDTLNIRVYPPEVFNTLNRDAGFELHEIDEIEYLDPVLQLKPVWVNVQKTGHAELEVNLEGACEEADSEDEKHLEGSLLMYLANKHFDRGELDEAESVLEQAIHYDPDRPEGYITWATIRVERDDLKGAFTLFELLTTRIADFAPGWVFRAQAEEALSRKSAALDSIRRAEALSDDPDLRVLTNEIRERLRGLK
jgi:SAM-dependent methyltransferase